LPNQGFEEQSNNLQTTKGLGICDTPHRFKDKGEVRRIPRRLVDARLRGLDELNIAIPLNVLDEVQQMLWTF